MTWTKAVFLACLAVVALAASASAQPTGCTTVSPGIVDGTFEAGDPWPAWPVQTSTNFGTPICDLLTCGIGGGTVPPFGGNNWVFFGGIAAAETAMIRQDVIIPSGPFLFVRFRMRMGAVAAPFTDTLAVRVDATTVTTFTEPSTAEGAYVERFVNVTAFANGNLRQITFLFTHPAGSIANFGVDDISLISCTTPVELMDFKIE